MNRLLIAFIVCSLSLMATAQNSDEKTPLENHPGYASLDTAAILGDRVPDTNIILPKSLLQTGAAILENAQPAVASLAKDLDFMRVQKFLNLKADESPAPNAAQVHAAVTQQCKHLMQQGWLQIATFSNAQEGGNAYTTVLMKFRENGNLLGIAIIKEQLPERFVYINFGGDIPSDALGKTGLSGLIATDALNELAVPQTKSENASAE